VPASARSSLRPLFRGGTLRCITRTRKCAAGRRTLATSLRGANATKQSRLFPRRSLDCFASLAMTASIGFRCHARGCGHPVRRGLSARAPGPLEYWIARFRLRQGFDAAANSRARRSFGEGGKPGDDDGEDGRGLPPCPPGARPRAYAAPPRRFPLVPSRPNLGENWFPLGCKRLYGAAQVSSVSLGSSSKIKGLMDNQGLWRVA
jgi:hypothetical protein